MGKKILLIESDAAFARDLSAELERKGFEVRVAGDGKDGLDLAHEDRPDAIVLCVELPKMSGYSICQKLKKDDALKTTPLVLTSAEATPETFEQHKKLKARAEAYLLKPFDPSALLEQLSTLVGLPPEPSSDEEVVSLEEEMALETLDEAEPAPAAKALELEEAATPKPPDAALPEEDEDLRLFDDAFESLSAAPPSETRVSDIDERSVSDEDLEAAARSLPDPGPIPTDAVIDRLGEEADAALAALGADEPDEPGPVLPTERVEPAGPLLRAASAEALRAAGIPVLETPVAPPRAPEPVIEKPSAVRPPDAETTGMRRLKDDVARATRRATEAEEQATAAERRAMEAEENAAAAEEAAREREAELKSLRAKVEALTASARKAEADLRAQGEDARRAQDRAGALEKDLEEVRARVAAAERAAQRKAAEAAEATGKLDALERELDGLRTELLVAQGEAEGAHGEIDRRTAELRKRLSDLEAQAAKNEERLIKAYQKIKGDEKIREKTRKALVIALQLVDEHGTGEPAAEAAPRPAVVRE